MTKIDRVLLVDDDEICSYLHQLLMEEADVAKEFKHISDPRVALKYMLDYYSTQPAIKPDCPDLVFLDINMPGIDGFEFLEELDQLSEVDQTKFLIIMLTVSDHPNDKEKVDSMGNKIAAYLNKPLLEEDIQKVLSLLSEECR